MANMHPLNSCAVTELANIRVGRQVPSAKPDKWGYSGYTYEPPSPEHQVKVALKGSLGTAIIFSDPAPFKFGPKLAAYIRRHKLGTVRSVEGVNYKYNDGHKVKVFMWLLDKEKAKAYEEKMIASGKWGKNWRIDRD